MPFQTRRVIVLVVKSYSSCNRTRQAIAIFRTRRVIAIFRTCHPNRVPSLLHHSHPVRLHYLEEDPLALTEVKLTWKDHASRFAEEDPHRIIQMKTIWTLTSRPSCKLTCQIRPTWALRASQPHLSPRQGTGRSKSDVYHQRSQLVASNKPGISPPHWAASSRLVTSL